MSFPFAVGLREYVVAAAAVSAPGGAATGSACIHVAGWVAGILKILVSVGDAIIEETKRSNDYGGDKTVEMRARTALDLGAVLPIFSYSVFLTWTQTSANN